MPKAKRHKVRRFTKSATESRTTEPSGEQAARHIMGATLSLPHCILLPFLLLGTVLPGSILLRDWSLQLLSFTFPRVYRGVKVTRSWAESLVSETMRISLLGVRLLPCLSQTILLALPSLAMTLIPFARVVANFIHAVALFCLTGTCIIEIPVAWGGGLVAKVRQDLMTQAHPPVEIERVQRVVNLKKVWKFFFTGYYLVGDSEQIIPVWHGTKANSALKVATEGLRTEHASVKSLRGKGLYGASNYLYSLDGYAHRMAYNSHGQLESDVHGNIKVLLVCAFRADPERDCLDTNFVVRHDDLTLVTHVVYFKLK